MRVGNIEMEIWYNHQRREHEVYFFEYKRNKALYLCPKTKDWVEVEEGQRMEPFFSISRGCHNKFYESILHSLERNSKATDIEEKVEKKMKGKMKAMQYHLEDMRKLVFKDKYENDFRDDRT